MQFKVETVMSTVTPTHSCYVGFSCAACLLHQETLPLKSPCFSHMMESAGCAEVSFREKPESELSGQVLKIRNQSLPLSPADATAMTYLLVLSPLSLPLRSFLVFNVTVAAVIRVGT